MRLDKLSPEDAREMLAICREVLHVFGPLVHQRSAARRTMDRLIVIARSDQHPPFPDEKSS